jgi:multidrug resistance efflux pump
MNCALYAKSLFATFFAILLLFLPACNHSAPKEIIVSGRVEVDDVHIGSKIGGRISSVNTREGEIVRRGTPIVQLEDSELQASLAQAIAATSQSQAQLDLLLAGTRPEDIEKAEAMVNANRSELELRKKGFREEEIREADAQLASAQSTLDLSKREYERAAALAKTHTIDQSEFDKARSSYATAQAQFEVARQRKALVHSGSRPEEISMAESQLKQSEADLQRLKNGPRPEEIAAQRAAVDASKANAERITAQLDETRIPAPSDALVETLDLQPGDLVKAGETLAVLNLLTSPWVRCYLPENRLSWVKPGMTVNVTVDSIPGRALKGRVRRLSSEAEFTPRNVQTQEKRSELVFEMKVDITDGGKDLRAGMYADVHVPQP